MTYTAVYETADGGQFPAVVLNVLGTEGAGRAREVNGPNISQSQLGDLTALAPELWSGLEVPVPSGLIEHVVEEGSQSDLFLGVTPETWSPLGAASRASFQQLLRSEVPIGADSGVARAGDTAGGSPVITFSVDGTPIAALSFDPDAFVVPLPAGVSAVVVTSEPAAASDLAVLNGAIPEGAPDELIVWRVYSGGNSFFRDTFSSVREGAHRITASSLEGGTGLIVGRAVRVAAASAGARDPLRKGRLRKAELDNADILTTCPDLSHLQDRPVDKAVVVVHGTMSTGFNLARAVRDVADADTEFKGMNVFRFEHDTWLGVETNARQLASFVSNAIRTRVSFVAHSRGGLVAARAAGLVASSVGVEAVVTLGTPFAGTPLAGGAPLAWSAVHALMGGLRYLGGPVVDVMTRLASLALRSAPPEGITDMKQNSLGLGLLRQYPHAGLLTVAGVASNATDRHGLAGFRQGVGNGAFGGEPNDLVVAEASALGGVPGTTIASDHYSYLEDQPEVNSLLWRAICLTDNPARLCRDLPVSTKDKIARLRALAPHPTLEKGVMGTPPNPE